MPQDDIPQEQVQALRSVNKNPPLDLAAPTSPSEIIHVEITIDPDTKREVALWDDILQAFKHAEQVRHKTKVVPFLKGKDLRILDPRRIAALPNTVLDVIVDNPVANRGIAYLQDQQPEPLPVIFSQGATITSSVRRNPVYGLEEAAMDNYSHIDKPLSFPLARGPHALLKDQTPTTVGNLSISSRPDSGDKPQLRGPHSSTTNTPVELDLTQTNISASHSDNDNQAVLTRDWSEPRGSRLEKYPGEQQVQLSLTGRFKSPKSDIKVQSQRFFLSMVPTLSKG